MKPLADLTDAQRLALRVIDSANTLYKRRSGWSNRSAIIQPVTIEKLVSYGLVRIRDVKRNGYIFPVATLTDMGEVYVEQLKAKPGRRKAA
ncbi:hypothetical protein [Pleomorphomonas koreensis]|uniref:hypothetical protein n=1 Tax=Pleomorphomonas koreensis TaxID=257440 RepID=UPI0003F7C2D2|nr:hypothetical protein [Pleomorphomonas koreensis]